MNNSNDSALVLFSGGQDSTVALAWALERFARVETVGFDYGQRHVVELDVRPRLRARMAALKPEWQARLGDDHRISIDALAAISDSALTSETAIAFADSGLPNTFVPARNLIFFTFAGALAYRRGARHIVAGMCETDYSGYPDCRDDTVKAMQVALSLGLDKRVTIHTPLMWIDKAATFALAARNRRAGLPRYRCRGHPYLLRGRPHAPAPLGLWLRRVSGLRPAGAKDMLALSLNNHG